MKKLIVVAVFLGLLSKTAAQVGIGSTNPRGMLEVAGNILLEGPITDEININASGSPFLLVRSSESVPAGELKLLDVTKRNVGPVNKYVVNISNVNNDEVLNLTTNLPTSKYVIAITDAVFSNTSSKILSNGSYGSFSTEITKKTISDIEYNAINLDFKGASETIGGTDGTGNTQNPYGKWTIGLVVYERELVKDWGTFNGTVSKTGDATYTGTSTNTPAPLQ